MIRKGLQQVKNNDIKGMKKVALEDLVSCVLIHFMENLEKLGWNGKTPVAEWYLGLGEKKRFQISDRLLSMMDPKKS